MEQKEHKHGHDRLTVCLALWELAQISSYNLRLRKMVLYVPEGIINQGK